MRRIIETILILALSCIPLGGLNASAEFVPALLAGIILCHLALFSPLGYMEYGVALIYAGLAWFFPEMGLMAPLVVYGLYQRKPSLALVPLISVLIPLQVVSLLISGLAIWMSQKELESRHKERKYMAMRDDFVQNEMLQRMVLKEEELNHEKNLEIAVLKERNRISREIHDSVGHTISSAMLQLEAMKVTAGESEKEKLTKLSRAMTTGMEEIRASLHNLQSESISLQTEVEQLTEPMKSTYQIFTTLQMEEDIPLPVKRAVKNLIREALTNIQKHSDATEIRIILRELPQHYTAGVKDNGSEKKRQQGLGLSTQEEAARALGGVFSSGWSDGFFVHMAIPKDTASRLEE